MNIFAQAQKPNDAAIRILPFLDDGILDTHLVRLSKQFDIPADWLIRDFKAEKHKSLSFYAGSEKIILLGLGRTSTRKELVKTFRKLSEGYKESDLSVFCIDFRSESIPPETMALFTEAAVEGLYLGGYHPGRFKSQPSFQHPFWKGSAALYLLAAPDLLPALKSAGDRGFQQGHTLARIMDLVNAPANHKTPADLAEWTLQSGREYGYKVEVLEKNELKQKGFHALMAVNQGSADPAVLIRMEYRGSENASLTALVGKGVTFDTGGVSIKPSSNMHHMKSDMGGAAAVLGAMELAARLKLPINLVAAVPVTDNSVGTLAVKPGDVIPSYSGKTIEVIDTDAEGRLILADAISYVVRQFAPAKLIDLATLTGSAVSTFGYKAAAFFTNHEGMATDFSQASTYTGERIWRLPLWEEYAEDLQSDVADLRNFSGKPLAGAIGAAKFLESFIDEHPQWAHFDIAGVAFNDTSFTKMKAATAFGVHLLLRYLTNSR